MSVVADVHGTGEDPPEAGAVRIAASDGTSLALEVAPGGAVTLALDDDGDGVVDATIPAAWTDLR